MHAHRLILILISALIVVAAGCAGEGETGENASGDARTAAPARPSDTPESKDREPVQQEGPLPGLSVSARHMHLHAKQLARLNAALDAGDLEAAGTPAYWLSRHETVTGISEDLGPYIDDMRNAAREVEEAVDLASARAAAGKVDQACQACHDDQGINPR